MATKKLILVPSELMDKNQKTDRNENQLIRMSKSVREYMDFPDPKVELFLKSEKVEVRENNTMLLEIFKSYKEDIKKAKHEMELSPEELNRVGFVTSKTYKKLTNGSVKDLYKNIWITDDIINTVIGADPEFILFHDNEIMRASNFLPHDGLIGSDGGLAEVRPNPTVKPENLIKNIKSIFENKKLTHAIKDLDWFGGCYYGDNTRGYPIGGHIHLGNPVKLANVDIQLRRLFFQSYNKILDELLSLPMIKIDGKMHGSKRRSGNLVNYGYFGELRIHSGRLEHRTLSGMWLVHPKLATLVIGTAKAIIEEVYLLSNENKFKTDYIFPSKFEGANVWNSDFDKWSEMPIMKDMQCTANSNFMASVINQSLSSEITTDFIKNWINKLKGFSTYKKYSYYIDNLYELLKHNSEELINCNKNLKVNWLEGEDFL